MNDRFLLKFLPGLRDRLEALKARTGHRTLTGLVNSLLTQAVEKLEFEARKKGLH